MKTCFILFKIHIKTFLISEIYEKYHFTFQATMMNNSHVPFKMNIWLIKCNCVYTFQKVNKEQEASENWKHEEQIDVCHESREGSVSKILRLILFLYQLLLCSTVKSILQFLWCQRHPQSLFTKSICVAVFIQLTETETEKVNSVN